MKTFFLCWDNTNFKLYLIRTNLNCPLSPSAKFLHFQNGFLFVWKNSPAACSNSWPQFELSFDTDLQFNMWRKYEKRWRKEKTFAGEFLQIFQTFEQKACLHEMYPTFLSDKTPWEPTGESFFSMQLYFTTNAKLCKGKVTLVKLE